MSRITLHKNSILSRIKSSYYNKTIQARAAFWFVICNFLPQGISVITVPIYTRLLSTSDYGISSNYQAWYSIISLFVTLSLNAGVYNNAMLKYENRRDEFDSSMMGLSILLGGIWFVISVICLEPLSQCLTLPKSLVICLALNCLTYNSYGCWVSRTKFEYKYRNLVILTLITSIMNPIFCIIAIQISFYKAIAKVWVATSIVIVLGVIFYIRAFKKSKMIFSKEYWKFALSFNIPLLPHYLSMIVLNQSDRIMITSICGLSDNGKYSLAYQASSVLLIFNSAITSSFTPWIYNKLKLKQTNDIMKTAFRLQVLFATIIILFILFAPELINIFATSEYYEAIYVIPPVATSMFFIFIYNLVSTMEFYHEKVGMVAISSSSAAVLNIILNLIFINRFGFIAAGYTTLFSYIIYSILHIRTCHFISKEHYNRQDVFYMRRGITIGIILIILSLVCTYLYQYILIRWFIIVLAVCILITKRKNVLCIINKQE